MVGKHFTLCKKTHGQNETLLQLLGFHSEINQKLNEILLLFEDYLVVDHDHFSGEILGLAHYSCNVNIGRVSNNLTCKIFAHNAAFDNDVMIVGGIIKTLDLHFYGVECKEEDHYKKMLSHVLLEDIFVIGSNQNKLRIINFNKHIRITDTMRILNCSLDNASSMISKKAQIQVQNSMLRYLLENNFTTEETNKEFFNNDLLKQCFIKKTIFPYSQIDDHLLDIEYKELPPIEMFAENDLSKSVNLQEEIKKLEPSYEIVKRLWDFLKLKKLRSLLEIYAVLDTVVLGSVMLDFDKRTFLKTKFHLLSAVSIFSIAAQLNSYVSQISIQYPPSPIHNEMIEKSLRGGFSSNGQRYAADSNYLKEQNPPAQLKSEGCVMMSDENSQYGNVEQQPLLMQVSYALDYKTKRIEDAIDLYHKPNDKGFSTSALVHCIIKMNPEYQDRVGLHSPMVQRGTINLEYFSPAEILVKRRIKRYGKYTIAKDTSQKLLMKLDSHESVETLETIIWLIEQCGCVVEHIFKILPVWCYPLARQTVSVNIANRREAIRIGDKVTDANCKLLTNGLFGMFARDSRKDNKIIYYVNQEKNLQRIIENIHRCRNILLSRNFSDLVIKNSISIPLRDIFYDVSGQFIAVESARYKVDIMAEKIVLDGYETVDYSYESFYREKIKHLVLDIDTKLILIQNLTTTEGCVDAFQTIGNGDCSHLENAVIMCKKDKYNCVDKSLRLTAAFVLSLAKLSIGKFAWDLGCVLRKKNLKKRLLATDTDSGCYFIFSNQARLEDTVFREHVKNLKIGWTILNYPKEHPFYSDRNAKACGFFQDEFPPPKFICEAVAMAPKCYGILSKEEDKLNKTSLKKRTKGLNSSRIDFINFILGFNTYPCERRFSNLENQLENGSQPFRENRLNISHNGINIVNKCVQFLQGFNQKNYVFDNGITSEIRDHYRLKPIVSANLSVLPNFNKFCSDEHIQTLLVLEKQIIQQCDIYLTLENLARDIYIPKLFHLKKTHMNSKLKRNISENLY
ncbi:TPA_asm: PolB [Hydra MELD virus]|nr:TPA_asm: PolB [Hydra MELD virus]